MAKRFEGVYSALMSVYDENLKVKKDTVRKLVKYQLDGGVKGFYVQGNTGECMVLPNRTRMEMMEAVLEEANHGEIIAHVGAVRWEDTLELIRHANAIGVDAIASLPPALGAYNYNEQNIMNYYQKLAELSDAPVLAYITPVYKGDVVKFAENLMKIDNICGIKLTIPNYYNFERIIHCNPGINVLNGPDESLLAALVMGADGGIGTSYNILPANITKVYDEFKKGNFAAALAAQSKQNTLIEDALKSSIGLAYWKAYLTVLGFDMGYTVFPSSAPTAEDYKRIEGVLRQIEEIK